MAKDDKVTGLYYTTRSDGVKLYRFAVPNTKTGDKWDKPQFKIRQDQTGEPYDEAIDVENTSYTYTETDIPVEAEATTETEQKAAAFDYLTGRSESSE